MTTIAEVNDFRIFFYDNEGQLEQIPSVFVASDLNVAQFAIGLEKTPSVSLVQNNGIDPETMAEITNLVRLVATEIRTDWLNGFT